MVNILGFDLLSFGRVSFFYFFSFCLKFKFGLYFFFKTINQISIGIWYIRERVFNYKNEEDINVSHLLSCLDDL